MPSNKDFEVKNGLKVTQSANVGGTLTAGNTTVGTLAAGNTTVTGTFSAGNTTVDVLTYNSASIAVDALGTVASSGTATLDFPTGSAWTVTHGGNITYNFTNLPSGYWEMAVIATNAGAGTLAFKVSGVSATVTWVKGDGTSSTTFSDIGVTLQSSGTNQFVFWGIGSTIYGKAA